MAGRNLPARVALLRERFSAEELARVYGLRRTWLGGAIHAGREQPMNRKSISREPWEGSRTLPRRIRWAKPSSVNAMTLAITMALSAGCGSDLGGVFVMPTH